jgi:hypothetical protein
MTAQDIFNEIIAHIKKQGGAYLDWYCGITSDWETRLFVEHKVPKSQDYWYMARQCDNDTAARNVEKALVEMGCDGGEGGGDNTSIWVYAYLKGSKTDP